MIDPIDSRLARIRLLIFAAVIALHITLIAGAVFRAPPRARAEEPAARVMKLFDLREQAPQPASPRETPPATAPSEPPPVIRGAVEEPAAEHAEHPPEVPVPTAAAPAEQYVTGEYAAPEQIEYLPQHRVSRLPVLPEEDIRRATTYPPIALRSGVEGTVYLELFIDRGGIIREVRVLRENPSGRGFGAAALNAFTGIRALKPAEVNGEAAAIRYRYSVTFRVR